MNKFAIKYRVINILIFKTMNLQKYSHKIPY